MPLFLFINTEQIDGKWLGGQVYSLIYPLSNHLLDNYSVPGSVVTIGFHRGQGTLSSRDGQWIVQPKGMEHAS